MHLAWWVASPVEPEPELGDGVEEEEMREEASPSLPENVAASACSPLAPMPRASRGQATGGGGGSSQLSLGAWHLVGARGVLGE